MKVKYDLRKALAVALPLPIYGFMGLSGAAWAQEQVQDEPAERMVLDDIVVTAEKRESSLQDTPVAVTALTDVMLEERNINDLRKVSNLAPSMVFNSANGNATIYMRGIGTDTNTAVAEPGVAMFVDGVYMGTTNEQTATFENIERVEVLRGPQGTLYGRNTTGGNVNIFTKLPSDESEFNASLLVGDYGQVKGTVYASGGLIDGLLAGGISLVTDSYDGYRENLETGERVEGRETLSAAFTTLFTPSENFEFILRGDWSDSDDDGPLVHFGEVVPTSNFYNPIDLGGEVGPSPEEIRNDQDTSYDRENRGLSGTINWDIGDITVRSITAYRESINSGFIDNDGTNFNLVTLAQTQESEMFSQEFNIFGEIGDSFEWIAGLYYFDQDTLVEFEIELPGAQAPVEAFLETVTELQLGLPPGTLTGSFAGALAFGGTRLDGVSTAAFPFLDFSNQQKSESTALFAQGTYALSDRLNLTAGVRFTEDTKKNNQTVTSNLLDPADVCFGLQLEESYDELTYKLSADYQINEDAMVYGSYSTGYKAGGFNTGSCNDSFDPETVDSIEVGIKSTLADGRLRLNLAAFHYQYDDFQAEITDANTSSIENAASVENTGLEVEFAWLPAEGWQLDGGLSLMNSEFKEFMSIDPMFALDPVLGTTLQDLSGNQTQRSPDQSYNFGAQYTHGVGNGDITFRYEASYKDDYFTTAFNQDFARIDAQTLQNLRVNWNVNERFEVAAFVENLTDEDVIDSLFASAPVGGTTLGYGPPRLWGLQVRYKH